jgi:hypothetical protein
MPNYMSAWFSVNGLSLHIKKKNLVILAKTIFKMVYSKLLIKLK